MIRVLKLNANNEAGIESDANGSWVHCVNPTESELDQLRDSGAPSEFLAHVLDPGERTRIVRKANAVHMVIHLPYELDRPSKVPYATVPISLLLLPSQVISIEPRDIGLFEKLTPIAPSRLSDHDKTLFVLDMLLLAATDYLTYLQAVNLAVEQAEDRLQRSLRNQEVIQLLNSQKSLVYFSTALNSIEMMLEKLRKGDFLVWSQANTEKAGDAQIEVRQAIYQVEIAQDILTQMMDAFASIVSNNLNTVMKFLAAITIVISVPMLIASLYGMNVPLPGELDSQTFGLLVAASSLLSLVVIGLFRRKDWL